MKSKRSVHFIRKLRSSSGESFAEVMIAILVTAFGSLVLAAMISTSQKIVGKAGKKEDARSKALAVMEEALAADDPSNPIEGTNVTDDTIKILNLDDLISSKKKNSLGTGYSVKIYYYSSEENSAYKDLKVYRYCE
ncbi:MAG: hypothetical protein U0L49_10970 [Eubacterium sp.]|nr:hypothetical protein [Eubacterium sp.]